ncbi:gliding motility-associated C-terminal domain-containing protein [Pedobacter cryophilus]|uniref:Gliding motility-associated C-terminal domain-containing protein n=1 Tax=Pedobacter cryophilus TaxID=2571271 RepID=A0A4U1BSW6_9SPHI|nr:gliding motility-associated C-terminal domain-containing protein [Pedobacter cryophilus]TKB95154.1 gliding motility-associated C-terminal domain-containing protein [Pedobacter cryophilus]
MKLKLLLVFLLCSNFKLNAQVCTGSLGDPTVVINFGSGPSSVGPSLGAASTSYQYKGADCPDDGQYVITNRTTSCFSNTWHTLTEDHTPNDTNGYMFLVNAANNPGIFYTFSVENLCPNTTYEFSSFIANVIKSSAPCGVITKPKITFRVEQEDGTLINTYSTGFINDTNSPEWKSYGFFFKSPSNVSKVVLKLINDSGGGCGNDIALDDITFRPCGPTILAQTVGITTGGNLQLCEGLSANYNFRADVSTGYLDPAFIWQVDKNDGQGWFDVPNSNTKDLNVFIANADLKGYTYRMAAAEKENITSLSCRVFSNPISITVNQKFTVNAGLDIYVLENRPTKIMAVAPPNLTYKWSPVTYLDDATLLQPTATATVTTSYKLVVTDSQSGCEAEDEVTIYVDQDLKIPDSFTPNGDGVNDLWEINGVMGSADVDISVFNRYGQIVFKSKGYQKGWDGKLKNIPLPQGMYYYIIDAHSPQLPVYKGSLLMIR